MIFFNDTTLRKSLIRTDELQISEMNELIYKIISDAFVKTKGAEVNYFCAIL